jgi:hypothetical protein
LKSALKDKENEAAIDFNFFILYSYFHTFSLSWYSSTATIYRQQYTGSTATSHKCDIFINAEFLAGRYFMGFRASMAPYNFDKVSLSLT